MKSYNQYCGLAKALDVVGDRWTLLIVRELLVRGPCRYTDLRHGLPGIATNLLVDRLRDLEAFGVVAREEAAPPIATALFSLTQWGSELKPIILALGKWSAPLMTRSPRSRDAFMSYWLALPLESQLTDQSPGRRSITIALRVGGDPLVIETEGGGVRVRPGSVAEPDVVLEGPPDVAFGLLIGQMDLAAARARRLSVRGDPAVLDRVRPLIPVTPHVWPSSDRPPTHGARERGTPTAPSRSTRSRPR